MNAGEYFLGMRIFLFWKPVLWLLIIALLSLMPGNELPQIPLFAGADKLVHAVMYAGLAVLLIRPLLQLKFVYPYWFAVAISLAIGGVIEIVQGSLATGRSGSWFDFWANLGGALLGILFFRVAVAGKKWEPLF